MTADTKRVLIYGATGMVGRHVVEEARSRGHFVVGVTRCGASTTVHGVEVWQSDAADSEAVQRLSTGFDTVVSATRPTAGREAEHVEAAAGLVAGLRGTGRRLVIVGGAASLVVPASKTGLVLDDSRYVHDEWRAIAQACVDQLSVLQGARSLEWTYISPPAFLETGPRTGIFRRGVDHLVVDQQGRSRISYWDFAVAVVDEIEREVARRRVTAGY